MTHCFAVTFSRAEGVMLKETSAGRGAGMREGGDVQTEKSFSVWTLFKKKQRDLMCMD